MSKKNTDKTKVEAPKTKRNPIIFALSVLLLVVIAIAFVFSPGLISQNTGMPDLGSYDGKAIEYDEEFVNLVEYFTEQLQFQGTQGDPMFSAMTQAFNYSVLTHAFVDEVEKSGYVAPTSLVNREMIQYFQDENGVYSERLFQETPDGTKIQIKEATEEGIKRNLYFNDLSGIKTSASEIAFINEMNKNQRSFNMVSFDTGDYPAEEVIAYGTDNAELFTIYSMDVITVNDESTAKTVLGRITNNELTFSDAVTEYSIDQYSTDAGKLNDSMHYQLKDIVNGEEAFNTLVALQSGEVSEVIETTTGFSIFSVTANPTLATFPNEELQSAVYSYLTIFEAGRIEDYYINLAKDFASSSITNGYNAAVSEYGLTNASIDAFPVNYASTPLLDTIPTDNSTVLSQAQSNEQFFETAFSLTEGEVSEPIVLGNNVIVLSLVEEITNEEENQNLDFLYPYYVTQFDSTDISSFFMGSEKVENNLFSVLLEYFL